MNWENANHIIPYLFLGNMQAAYDENFILSNNIKLVVNCTRDIKIPDWYERNGVAVIRLPLNDSDTQADNQILSDNIEKIVETVNNYRIDRKNVFIHCYAGMQRSATVIAVYLMKYYNYRPEHAIFYIRHKRRVAFNPRPTFSRFINNYPNKNN